MEPHEHVEQSIPDARDLEVYRLAKVERQSTRVIAQILGVSQTRVRQLIDRAEAFLVAVAPDGKDKQVRGKCVRVAEQLAAERVDFLYGEALEHFRQQGDEAAATQTTRFFVANNAPGGFGGTAVNPHFFYRSPCGSHSVLYTRAFKGRPGGTGARHQPVAAAQDYLAIRANVHKQAHRQRIIQPG